MRLQSWGSLVLGLAMTGSATAQPSGPMRLGGERASPTQDKEQTGAAAPKRPSGPMRLGGRKEKDRDTRTFGEGRGQEIDPSVLEPKRLIKELKLEWQQKDELEQIFREYNAAIADLRRESGASDTQREKERLEQEWKSARAARDTRRAAEIYAKLRELRTSVSDEEKQYRELLIEEIEKILDDGQKQQFRDMLRPGSKRGRGVGPLDDPKVLFQCLQQIKVQDYQKTQLEQAKRIYDDEIKRRGKYLRPEEEKGLRKRLFDEVMMILDDEQEKELKRVHARMGGPGASGRSVDVNDPRQLQYAIMRLNATKHRLSTDQSTEIRRIQKQYMQELRGLPRDDPEARRRADEQVAQQVLAVLTSEQQEAVKEMEMPAGRFMRGRGDRSSRVRGRYGRDRDSDDEDAYGRGRRRSRSRDSRGY